MASIFTGFALSVHQSVLGNFAVQNLHLDAASYGVLTGLKELPGMLVFLLIALVVRVHPLTALSMSALLIGLGISITGTASEFIWLVLFTILMSIGLHLWSVLRDTVVMQQASRGAQAQVLGKFVSLDAGAGVAGMGAVWLASSHMDLRTILLLSGVFGLVACVSLAFRHRQSLGPAPDLLQRQFVFRKAYSRYYILVVISASREMVTLTFGTYLLLQAFHTSVQTMTVLLLVRSLLAIVTRPVIGRFVDRAGHVRAFALNYTLLIFVFLAYGFVHSFVFVCALYILDNTLAGFDDVAVSSYAAALAEPLELAPTLAMGDSMAHVTALLLPMAGGWLWVTTGRVAVFFASAGIALMGLSYTLWLWRRRAESEFEAGVRGAAAGD